MSSATSPSLGPASKYATSSASVWTYRKGSSRGRAPVATAAAFSVLIVPTDRPRSRRAVDGTTTRWPDQPSGRATRAADDARLLLRRGSHGGAANETKPRIARRLPRRARTSLGDDWNSESRGTGFA